MLCCGSGLKSFGVPYDKGPQSTRLVCTPGRGRRQGTRGACEVSNRSGGVEIACQGGPELPFFKGRNRVGTCGLAARLNSVVAGYLNFELAR